MQNVTSTAAQSATERGLTVAQDPAKPIAAEVMAQAIVDIAEGMKRINASRLTREAIVILLHEYTRVSKTDVRHVLIGLDDLEAEYLKPKVAR